MVLGKILYEYTSLEERDWKERLPTLVLKHVRKRGRLTKVGWARA